MDQPTSESHLHVMSLKIDVALILDGQLELLHNALMHHFFTLSVHHRKLVYLETFLRVLALTMFNVVANGNKGFFSLTASIQYKLC